ncbi:hypothetical protein BCh11DRAFT_00599 [Burkholderia sp. Ch1-1]|uniref:DUF6697 domain-containing protein n=1 Tax=Paraburkholderia dioscoreae TaxID=2604047 RepID=A0A5Q4ZAK0_9BURK|nr:MULTISPECIES: hypothetical protein [Paraburkholderia]EIF32858.1 hypothetical protein BCh11DRAFT_00599 [Burkholderia sp. Ch1-1]MDR8402102.1 hypothetical protein [Paraburkholderia sp. USG1]VVD31709.1 conserved protein of unknown function [Paraburkholderia dioscoreae]
MFEAGKEYSREEIHSVTGGCKQAFLPVKGGKVVAARLRQDLNPHAPDVIVCDSSAAARAAGRTLARQTDPLPVFVRTATDRFRYMGEYVTDKSLTAPGDYAQYVQNTGFTLGQISRVIKMKRR